MASLDGSGNESLSNTSVARLEQIEQFQKEFADHFPNAPIAM
jgi:hypothetical protein